MQLHSRFVSGIRNNRGNSYEIRFWETKSDEDRVFMCEQTNIYRAMCRDKKRGHNQGEASKMVKLSKSDPKRFWREVKGV